MTLVPATRHAVPQSGNQGSGRVDRHDGANNNSPFGWLELHSLELDPANDTDEFVTHFDLDALDEIAGDRDRLGQTGRADYLLGHSDSFLDFVIGTAAGLGLLLAILFAAVLIVLGDAAVPALSVVFHMVGAGGQ